MTSQLKEKQEKFCQAYILHRNATRAAIAAGYSEASAHNQGYRLLQDDKIQERIEELTNEISTDVDVIAEIEKQYEQARNAGHGAVALKALELLSRVRGNNTEEEDITPESIEAEIIGTLQIIGFEKSFELLSRVRGNNSETEDVSSESLEKEIIDSMKIIGFEKVFELAAQAFPDQFADEDEEEYEDDEELLLTEELTSTTDTEAGSNDDT